MHALCLFLSALLLHLCLVPRPHYSARPLRLGSHDPSELLVPDNRDLVYILRRERLRERDFLNTEYCSRVNQRPFSRENMIAVVILLRVLARMS